MAKSKMNYSDEEFKSVPSVYTDVRNEIASEYPELEDIRSDLSALKDDVVHLTKHVKKNGGHHIEEARHYAADQLKKAQKAGSDALHKVEARAAERPGQTLAIAFIAGLAASFLLSGRKA